jgi:hypothetical protein
VLYSKIGDMIFLESTDSVKYAINTLQAGSCFIQFIDNDTIHSANDSPVVLIIHHIETKQTFVISFNHPDCVNIDCSILKLIQDTNSIKYIIDRKSSLYHVNFKNCKDIGWCIYSNTLTTISYNKFKSRDIRSVPIMMILKKFNDTLKNILYQITTTQIEDSTFHFEKDFTDALFEIEKNGLYTHEFNLGDLSLVNADNLVHSQYNMFTPTSRPSNRFGNVNYAALNKSEGQRDCFTSRYSDGAIIMMDYESYHLRLFGNYINFKLPDTSVHEYLGQLYYGKSNLSEEEYSLSKKITFNLIYGGIDDDIKNNVPFMKEVSDFVETTWSKYNKNKYVETWYYKRRLNSCLFREKEKPYVVFNYLLQAAETERNCKILMSLNNFLDNKKTKCILYTYDAFLFDLPKEEFLLLKDLVKIMNPDDKFPVKTYVGANYGDMVEFNV